jgi:serine protease Do
MTTFRLRLLGFVFATWTLALLLGVPLSSTAAASTTRRYDLILHPVFEKPVPETVDDLQAVQDHVERIVAKVMPAVVNVRIGAQGSGVIITEDGYVLTAGHVSGQPGRDCTLTFADGKQVKGKSLGQNKSADTGLIKIVDEGKYPYCEMGKSGDVKKGQWCIAIGHPGGLKPGRTPPVRLGRIVSPGGAFITTECTLVGGDSGGPLFDMHGKVIGIHSRIGNSITANMHVPVDTYRAEWERLVKGESWGAAGGGKGGNPQKGAAGRLSGVEFAADAKELKVAKVDAGSTADKAGLKVDDVILTVNGKKVTSPEEWRTEIGRSKAGDTVMLEVRRGTDTLMLKAVLDKAA